VTFWVIGVIAVVAIVSVTVAARSGRNRHQSDNIDSFRRQIDALSPEARRQTSERMKPSDTRSTDDDGA
jgi:Asp-tRNA(Asn)/Glu-tRNA(Gln) amidotransferase B subunit